MRGVGVAGVLLGAVALLGCGTDLGLGGGAKHGHAVGLGRLAVETKIGLPVNDHGFLVGANLESRSEESVGSRWSTGFMLGYGAGPPQFVGRRRWGYEIYGEAGVPLRKTFHGLNDAYLGVGVTFPIALTTSRAVTDLNRSTWLLKRSIELVPFAHARGYFGKDEPTCWSRIEYAGGLAFRFRIMTDIL
jgi:hypothetical protein